MQALHTVKRLNSSQVNSMLKLKKEPCNLCACGFAYLCKMPDLIHQTSWVPQVTPTLPVVGANLISLESTQIS